ncbi:MAG: asparagine--tRNA ligase [bacterium]
MKKNFIKDLLRMGPQDQEVEILCWIKSKRIHKNIIFLDVCDSTGEIQVVVEEKFDERSNFDLASKIKTESAVSVIGVFSKNMKNNYEILVSSLSLIGDVLMEITPSPRMDFDIFDERYTDLILKYRHLYIRNPKIMAILQFRNLLKNILREWFEQNNFTDFDAPILVPAPLYAGSTAIGVTIREEDVFLSQCAGFYLESAVHAFEKVYNMGPSFRGEESRSKRHLIEYWHIKAEIAWGNREDIIEIVESIFVYVGEELKKRAVELMKVIGCDLCLDGLKAPFPRLNYRDAIDLLKQGGMDINFGSSLGSEEEEILSRNYNSPFWIVGIPRTIEPFPYCIDPEDNELTMVADLIANNGYGELLGIAEKISEISMLNERMAEKNKEKDKIYDFVKDVHKVGCVPHIAFGMGLERLMRWLINIPHVRDCIPFPRVVRRTIMP